MAVIQMPSRGGMNESGMITRWYKKTGDWVESGDELFSFDTEEGTFTVKSQKAGRLVAIFVPEGEIVHCPADVGMLATPTPDNVLKMGRQQYIDESKPVDAPEIPAAVEAEDAPAEEAQEALPAEEPAEEMPVQEAEAEEVLVEEPVVEDAPEAEVPVREEAAETAYEAEEAVEEMAAEDELVAYDELAQEEMSAQDAEEIYEVERSAGEEDAGAEPVAEEKSSGDRWAQLQACFFEEDEEEEAEETEEVAEEEDAHALLDDVEHVPMTEEEIQQAVDEMMEIYNALPAEPAPPQPACISAEADMAECAHLVEKSGVQLRTWLRFAAMRSPLGEHMQQSEAQTLRELDEEACGDVLDVSGLGLKSVYAPGDGTLRLMLVAVRDGKGEIALSFDESRIALAEAAAALRGVCENLENPLNLLI